MEGAASARSSPHSCRRPAGGMRIREMGRRQMAGPLEIPRGRARSSACRRRSSRQVSRSVSDAGDRTDPRACRTARRGEPILHRRRRRERELARSGSVRIEPIQRVGARRVRASVVAAVLRFLGSGDRLLRSVREGTHAGVSRMAVGENAVGLPRLLPGVRVVVGVRSRQAYGGDGRRNERPLPVDEHGSGAYTYRHVR